VSLFEDIGYSIWAKERTARFIREGRQGENLGFCNRPDLNDPWSKPEPKISPIALRVLTVFGFILTVTVGIILGRLL
jgi:hypothetical protein